MIYSLGKSQGRQLRYWTVVVIHVLLGDEMNVELLLDRKEYEAFSRLAPHMGVLDTHAPFKISGNIKLPGPIMSTIVSWMHMGEE